MSKLPATRIIRCSFEFVLPVAATREEIDEWVKFNLHAADLDTMSPLSDFDLDALTPPELTDTGLHYREERTPLPDRPGEPGVKYFNVRRFRDVNPPEAA